MVGTGTFHILEWTCAATLFSDYEPPEPCSLGVVQTNKIIMLSQCILEWGGRLDPSRPSSETNLRGCASAPQVKSTRFIHVERFPFLVVLLKHEVMLSICLRLYAET